MRMTEARQLSARRNGLQGYGYFSGAYAKSAGLNGSIAEAQHEAEDDRRLQAVRLRDLNEPAKDQIVALATVMKDAEPTAFIYEAAALYALRSQRCLAGMPWREAAFEARAVVKFALTKVGAIRPSWEDGQPQFTPTAACVICDAPLYGAQVLYCGQQCETRGTEQRVAARLLAARTDRTCQHCGTKFTPGNSKGKFCSSSCYRKSLYRVEITDNLIDCTCQWCGNEFRAHHFRGRPAPRFCSSSCRCRWQWANRGMGPRKLRAASAECFRP